MTDTSTDAVMSMATHRDVSMAPFKAAAMLAALSAERDALRARAEAAEAEVWRWRVHVDNALRALRYDDA